MRKLDRFSLNNQHIAHSLFFDTSPSKTSLVKTGCKVKDLELLYLVSISLSKKKFFGHLINIEPIINNLYLNLYYL